MNAHVCDNKGSPACGMPAPAGNRPLRCIKCHDQLFECQAWHWDQEGKRGEHVECPSLPPLDLRILVEKLVESPRTRILIAVPTAERGDQVFASVIELIRINSQLKIVELSAGQVYLAPFMANPSVGVYVRGANVVQSRVDVLIYDGLANDPADKWLKELRIGKMLVNSRVLWTKLLIA